MAKAPKTSEGLGSSVVIEDAGPSRKRLKFTIPGARVAEQIETSMSALASEATLPGFRPGHAPRRLIEKRFGQSVRGEAKQQLISEAYTKAVQDNKLNVLGDPDGNDELEKLVPQPGKDMMFHIEVDVMPEFDVPAFEGLEVYKPLITPTEDQVTDQIQKLAINEGTLEARDEAEPGDYCIGHGVMRDKEGNTLVDIDGAVIQTPPEDKQGKGAILGVMVDDFGEQIGSPKPGDTLTVRTKGPENHETEAVRGKDLVIEFNVVQVQRILPCPVDDLVKRTGTGSEAALRQAMMDRLNQRVLIEQQSAMRQQIAKHLTDTIEVPVPERLSARQAEQNLSRARMELMYRGIDERQIEDRIAELRAASAANAVRALKLAFILAKIAETKQVKVTQEEVGGRVSQMAAERGARPDALFQDLQKRNQIGFVVQQIREHKTVDAIIAGAKITDIPLEEFNAKFGPSDGSSDAGGGVSGSSGSSGGSGGSGGAKKGGKKKS